MARLAYEQARSVEATAGILALHLDLCFSALERYRSWPARTEQRQLERDLYELLLAASLELVQVEDQAVDLADQIPPAAVDLCRHLKRAGVTARSLLGGLEGRDLDFRGATCVLAVTKARDTADRLRGHLGALSALGGADAQGEPLTFPHGLRRAPAWQT